MPTVVKPAHRKSSSQRASRSRKASLARTRRRAPARPKASEGAAELSWAELAGKAPPADVRRRERAPGLVEAIPTLRFAVMLAIACAVLTLYVGHLYASQSLVEEVQELRKQKLHLTLQQNRLRGEFDRMTAPSVILHRAEALGLRGSGEYGPVILVEP